METDVKSITSPREEIYDTIKRCQELDQAAYSALTDKRIEDNLELLRQRAQLVASLPERIQEATTRSEENVPPQLLRDLGIFADHAKEALAENKSFMIASALDLAPGRKIGEPFDLEKLMKQYYP